MITLIHYLSLSALLLIISFIGLMINRHNVIALLLSIELMLLAINTNFVAYSHYLHQLDGQVFALFILTIAACETAIGLAILICLYRAKKTVDISLFNRLKG